MRGELKLTYKLIEICPCAPLHMRGSAITKAVLMKVFFSDLRIPRELRQQFRWYFIVMFQRRMRIMGDTAFAEYCARIAETTGDKNSYGNRWWERFAVIGSLYLVAKYPYSYSRTAKTNTRFNTKYSRNGDETSTRIVRNPSSVFHNLRWTLSTDPENGFFFTLLELSHVPMHDRRAACSVAEKITVFPVQRTTVTPRSIN